MLPVLGHVILQDPVGFSKALGGRYVTEVSRVHCAGHEWACRRRTTCQTCSASTSSWRPPRARTRPCAWQPLARSSCLRPRAASGAASRAWQRRYVDVHPSTVSQSPADKATQCARTVQTGLKSGCRQVCVCPLASSCGLPLSAHTYTAGPCRDIEHIEHTYLIRLIQGSPVAAEGAC